MVRCLSRRFRQGFGRKSMKCKIKKHKSLRAKYNLAFAVAESGGNGHLATCCVRLTVQSARLWIRSMAGPGKMSGHFRLSSRVATVWVDDEWHHGCDDGVVDRLAKPVRFLRRRQVEMPRSLLAWKNPVDRGTVRS